MRSSVPRSTAKTAAIASPRSASAARPSRSSRIARPPRSSVSEPSFPMGKTRFCQRCTGPLGRRCRPVPLPAGAVSISPAGTAVMGRKYPRKLRVNLVARHWMQGGPMGELPGRRTASRPLTWLFFHAGREHAIHTLLGCKLYIYSVNCASLAQVTGARTVAGGKSQTNNKRVGGKSCED